MYRGASPIFDVPDFPALRRVKPLPKRRRTLPDPDGAIGHISTATSVAGGGTHRTATSTASLGLGLGLAMGLGIPSADGSTTTTTAEELLAHADSLSSLQSYYMPLIGGVQDLFRTEIKGGRATLDFTAVAGFTVGTAGVQPPSQQQQQQDDDDQDDDYIDHLQQPGNTKKRKVPTNMSGSPNRRDGGSSPSGGEDESTDKNNIPGSENDLTDTLTPAFASATAVLGSGSTAGAIGLAAGILSSRRGKITPATLAGLQHKEMLKNRKRQLVAVLGALSHGDALALDQALSASLPFMTAGVGDLRSMGPPKIRLSKREGPRCARAARMSAKSALVRHPDAIAFPTCEFTFVYPSASESLVSCVIPDLIHKTILLALFFNKKNLLGSSCVFIVHCENF